MYLPFLLVVHLLITDSSALLTLLRLRVVAVAFIHVLNRRAAVVRLHGAPLTDVLFGAWRLTRSGTLHKAILDAELLSTAYFTLLVLLARQLNLLLLRLSLGVQVLLRELGRDNSVLACLRFIESLSLNDTSLVQDFSHFVIGLAVLVLGNTRWHWLSSHLDGFLFGTARARSSNLNSAAEHSAVVNLRIFRTISS